MTRRLCILLLGLLCFGLGASTPDIGLQEDPALTEVDGRYKPGSHIKLYIPNLPYLAISHAINAALLKPANNARGWDYDIATGHTSVDDKIWEFTLRQNASFQDGSPFNADAVIENMMYFKQAPFTFTKLHTILDKVEKVDDFSVRFHLTEPYGVFPHDAVWLQFYTSDYLKKFGWNGKPTCPNLAEPGPYALGPYKLVKGYIEGDRRTAEVELEANLDYWGEDKPKVERITIYNNLSSEQALDLLLEQEGALDLMPIAFSDQVEAVMSRYAKLATSPSKNNYAMHFNMLNGNDAINDEDVRFVINQAIDQNYLLNLSMLGEGLLSPTTVSPEFYRVDDAIASLETYFAEHAKQHPASIPQLRARIQNYQRKRGRNPDDVLQLRILTQESFMFLVRDIQYFLAQVNIDLQADVLPIESEVFIQLFDTWKNKNTVQWDLLLWGNYDWYKHPWAAFFVYKPFGDWSTIPPTPYLDKITDELVKVGVDSPDYVPIVAELIRYVYENNLMVFLPTPNNVYAVNKEVVFYPGTSAFIYLRDIEVTDLHWSMRGDAPLPVHRMRPVMINRTGF